MGEDFKSEQKLQISSNCLEAVHNILGQIESPWEARSIVEDCRLLLEHIPSVNLAHEPRENNRAADWVAKAHKAADLPPDWITHPPHSLMLILCSDVETLFSDVI